MAVKRFLLASILTAFSVCPSTLAMSSAQQEVAPDHFDGTEATPQAHARTKATRKQDKAATSKRRQSSGNRRSHHK
jgi:hypothetical protein